jgi:MFS family permease
MTAVLKIPAFRRLAVGFTLNELGDWLATLALAILVYDATRSALATTALFIAAKFLPGLLVPALAARAERGAVARVLPAFYVVEAIVFGVLALVARDPWLPAICALAFLDGTIAATGRAVTRAANVAVLQPTDQLREGNAVINVSFSILSVTGPVIAAFLVAWLDAPLVIALTGALFLVLAVVMGTARDLPNGTTDETPWLERLRAGASYVASNPVVRTLIVGQALLLVLFTMVAPIEIVYAKESLDGGDAAYGVLLTGWGAGVVLGSLIYTRVHDRSLAALIVISTVLVGIGYLGMAAAPTLVVATAATVVGGLGNGVQWVVVVTAIQEAVRDDMQTRIAGFFEAVATGVPGLGFILGGVLTAALSPRVAFFVAGIGVIVIVLVGAAVWRARRDVREVVAVRADHPLAMTEIPLAPLGSLAVAEAAATPTPES